VFETDEDRQQIYEGRFDEYDFEGAYRELERRYFAGEGAAFAEAGAVGTEMTFAFNRGDLDRVFSELTTPDFRVETRTGSVFGDRSAAELRATFEELYAMVASTRIWHSAVCWLSPTISVGRNEREAIGHDGEMYAWTRLYVFEFRDGRVASMWEFGVDDEDAAFAYAAERVQAAASRLAVTNLASRMFEAGQRILKARDTDAAVACYAETFVYDDRRRLGGNPLDDLRTANERILAQYSQFEGRTLAVRGERLPWGGPAGRTSRGSRRPTSSCTRWTRADDSSTRAASMRTTSKAPIVNSTAAISPVKGPRSP